MLAPEWTERPPVGENESDMSPKKDWPKASHMFEMLRAANKPPTPSGHPYTVEFAGTEADAVISW